MRFLFESTSYNRTDTSGEENLISNILGVDCHLYLAKENDMLVRQAGFLVLLLTSVISLILDNSVQPNTFYNIAYRLYWLKFYSRRESRKKMIQK